MQPITKLALFAGLLAGCAPLDRSAPFQEAAFVRSVQAMNQAGRNARAGYGPYRAGWARVRIEAPEGVPLGGYGDRDGASSTGERDPAYVRAFAVQAGEARAIVLTTDLLLLTPNITDPIRAQFPKEQLFFTASHTHSGPGGFTSGLLWTLVLGEHDPRAQEAITTAIGKAIKGALARMEPVKIGAAEVRVAGLIKNRVEKAGRTDDQLWVLRMERLRDGGAAALWSYGCHAVWFPPEQMRISADYPGELARVQEGRGLEVLGFAAGGVGSSNPRYEHTQKKDWSWLVDPLKEKLQLALDRAAAQSKKAGELASARATVDVPPLRYRVTDEIALWSDLVESLIGMPYISFGAVSISDAVLLHMPAELSGQLTHALRAKARKKRIKMAVMPFNGTYLGYVVPKRIYDLPESKGEEMLHYETHVMTFLGPFGGDWMVNLGARLVAAARSRAKDAKAKHLRAKRWAMPELPPAPE